MKNPVCRHLDWDSDLFGVRIARVLTKRLDTETVQSVLRWCSENDVRCLYFLADSDDPETTRVAEDNGFRLVDVRVTMGADTENPLPCEIGSAGAVVRASTADDIPQLRLIARTSHRDSRFYHDRCFRRRRCDALYETWIEKSCNGYADAVLVADIAGRPVGYITCHHDGQTDGRIGLIGVHADHRRQRIGYGLVAGAMKLFARRGVRQVSVVTQGRNVRAQRLYQGCGFTTNSVELWYHRWFYRQHSVSHG